MQSHNINLLNNFIAGWFLNDKNICDEIINWHLNTAEKRDGNIHVGDNHKIVDKSIKSSIDSTFLPNNSAKNIAGKYCTELQNALNEYIKIYPCCNKYSAFGITEQINCQQYKPNDGYFGWHTERTSNKIPSSARHLVFITYLNDVNNDGETEFLHQKIKIKPQKGLTVIFPADWTFTHRGIPSPTQEKFILTGWFNFTE